MNRSRAAEAVSTSLRVAIIRASTPVALATAKLIPFRLRSGGTSGIGRGKPEARRRRRPFESTGRTLSRYWVASMRTPTTPSIAPGYPSRSSCSYAETMIGPRWIDRSTAGASSASRKSFGAPRLRLMSRTPRAPRPSRWHARAPRLAATRAERGPRRGFFERAEWLPRTLRGRRPGRRPRARWGSDCLPTQFCGTQAQPPPQPWKPESGLEPVSGTGVLMSFSTGAAEGVSPGSAPARSATSPHVESRSSIPWRTSSVRPFDPQ